KRSYDRFNNLRQYVLDPAVAAINAYGTVSVTMTPEKLGRAVQWVRFEWRWKDPHEAAAMAGEGSRQGEAQGKVQALAE
ncbi:replication initiation protein, partial [Escherichia coli]|uniref:replication initiation protein n=1 Tax=Escherichia coli TaxID=562 RepID=UPI002739CDCB